MSDCSMARQCQAGHHGMHSAAYPAKQTLTLETGCALACELAVCLHAHMEESLVPAPEIHGS